MKKFAGLVFGLFVILVVGCSSDASSDKREIVVVDFGGALSEAREEALFTPFEEEFDVNLILETPTNYGKFKAMVESGNVEWDVVNVDYDFVHRGTNEGLLEPIDYSVVDADIIVDEMVHEFAVGAEFWDVAISYNTDTYPDGDHPKTWAEFWDTEAHPGQRSLWRHPITTLEAALLADGVGPDELYPLDLDRAFASLDKIVDHVTWYTTGAQAPQMLASGEVELAAAWNGRIVVAREEGSPQNVEYNEALGMKDAWVVPKGAPNKDLAMEFINFVSQADKQAAFTNLIPYAPVNNAALEFINEERKEELGLGEYDVGYKVPIDFDYWADHFDEVNERFQEWLLE